MANLIKFKDTQSHSFLDVESGLESYKITQSNTFTKYQLVYVDQLAPGWHLAKGDNVDTFATHIVLEATSNYFVVANSGVIPFADITPFIPGPQVQGDFVATDMTTAGAMVGYGTLNQDSKITNFIGRLSDRGLELDFSLGSKVSPYLRKTTGETIAQGKAVALNSSGLLVVASKNSVSKVPVIGISLNSVGSGLVGTVVGDNTIVSIPGATFATIGNPVYLDNNGNLSQDPVYAVGEYRQIVGVATNTSEIIVFLGEPTVVSVASSSVKDGVGLILPFASTVDPPNGWIDCDGRAVSRATYANLFSVIGVIYGAGDGSTTFNLPDLRGQILKGAGTSNQFRETFDAMRFTGLPIDIASTATSTITTSTNHGLSVGDMVYLYGGSSNATSDRLGLGFVISTPALNTLTVSATVNGTAYASYTNTGLIKIAKVARTSLPATTVYSGANITIPTHGLTSGDIVMYPTQTVATPTGLTAFVQYRVTVVDANTFTLTNARTGANVASVSGTIGGIFRKLLQDVGTWQLDSVQDLTHQHNINPSTPTANYAGGSGGFYTFSSGGPGSGQSSDPIYSSGNGTPRLGFETRPFNFAVRYVIRHAPFQMMTISSGSSGSSTPTNVGISFPNGQFETDLADWAPYFDLAQATPVDGVGGASSLTAFLNSPSNLFGTNSLLISKGAVNAQGSGVGYSNFTIDKGMTTKTIDLSFSYIASANYVSGDVGVYVLDITNTVLIPVSNKDILSTSGGIGTHRLFFTPSNALSYRLIFHVQTTNALAYSLEVDNIQPTEYKAVIGAGIGQETAYTPTTQGLGTPTGLNVKYRIIGEKLRVLGTLTTGTVTASEVQIGLPSGFTSVSGYPTLQVIGHYTQSTSGANAGQILAEASKTYVTVGLQSGTQAGLAKILGTALSTGATYSFEFEVTCNELIGKNVVQLAQSAGPLYLSCPNFTGADSNDTSGVTYYGVDGMDIPTAPSFTRARYCEAVLPRDLLPNEEIRVQFRNKVTKNWVDGAIAGVPSQGIVSLVSGIRESAGNLFLRSFTISQIASNRIQLWFPLSILGMATGGYPETSGIIGKTYANLTNSTDGFDKVRIKISPQNAVELPPMIVVKAIKTSSQSITSDVTDITWTSILKDTAGAFNVNGTFTTPIDGWYRVTVSNMKTNTSTVTIYPWVAGVKQTNDFISYVLWSDESYASGTVLIYLLKGQAMVLRGTGTDTFVSTLGRLEITYEGK